MGSLEQNMLDVIQQVQSQQLHVQDNDGKWCILRIVPYRTMDNRIDGVVLSVMNEVGSSPAIRMDGRKAAGKAAARRKGESSSSKAVRRPGASKCCTGAKPGIAQSKPD